MLERLTEVEAEIMVREKVALRAGSSQEGKAFRASVGWREESEGRKRFSR